MKNPLKGKRRRNKGGKMENNEKQNTITEYIKNLPFLILILIVVAGFLLIYFLNMEVFKRDMLFWFFSATSQSMAALFAVVGMFLVFRYQDLQNRLQHHIRVLRNNMMTYEWSQFFGYDYSEEYISSLTDSELLYKAGNFLKEKKEKSQNKIYNNLDVYLIVIKNRINIRDKMIALARVPMIAILITFLISITSLIFIELYFSSGLMNYLGMVIILIMLVLIIFSMSSILRYFFLSTRVQNED